MTELKLNEEEIHATLASATCSTEELVDDVNKPKLQNQFIAAFIACIAAICAGLVLGWSSPALPDMNQPGRPKYLNEDQASLVSSISTFGALIGGVSAGALVDYFGRKLSFLLTGIPYVGGWILIAYSGYLPYSQNVWMLYAGRVITGFCVGLTCLNTSVYITEIASPSVRGLLGSWFQLFINSGILIAYIVGTYIPWSYLAMFSASISIIFMICMTFMPESPVWLMRQGNLVGAVQSLEFFRGRHYDVQSELDALQREKAKEVKMSFKELRNPVLLKPLLIIEIEMFLQQMCGINAVVFNIKDIFAKATTSIDPSYQAMIVGSVMVISSVVASGLMDKLGRRILLLICSIAMTVSLILLGTYFYLSAKEPETASKISWLPILCLVVFSSVFNLGFGPIPWLSMSELFPPQARGIASSIATATSWTLAFVITKTFSDLQGVIKPYGAFWLYSGFSFLAIFFVWFFVPETKGKSIEEIQALFK